MVCFFSLCMECSPCVLSGEILFLLLLLLFLLCACDSFAHIVIVVIEFESTVFVFFSHTTHKLDIGLLLPLAFVCLSPSPCQELVRNIPLPVWPSLVTGFQVPTYLHWNRAHPSFSVKLSMCAWSYSILYISHSAL